MFFLFVLVFFLLIIFLLTLSGIFFGVGWLPTRRRDFERIAHLCDIKPGMRFYDLGCGSAGLLTYLAKKYPLQCVGIEISPLLYLYSKIKTAFNQRIKIKYGHFFHTDISKADVVFIFLLPDLYSKLQKKFEKELKNGAVVICAAWPIPNWNPTRISQRMNALPLYQYKKPFLTSIKKVKT